MYFWRLQLVVIVTEIGIFLILSTSLYRGTSDLKMDKVV
jgi:hypothetical protein